jgi:radical SAM superfamily enzyme with C-terminal helix-hairpin-helix motif
MFRKSLMITGLALLLVALVACGGAATNTPVPTSEAALASPSPETVDSTAEVTGEAAATVEVTSEATVEATTEAEITAEATAEMTQAASISAVADCVKLDLNTLTEDDLMATIPDFSSRMVREFFEYRPYVSIQQFRREIGKYVDETQVADYEQYVYVPIDVNEADADTLMQIPGVDATLAESLIAGRPYTDNQAFLDALNADQAAQARCYLAVAS